jgi:ZIP family zinc transporter
VSTLQLWALGAIAGFTIFIGLPIGRLQRPAAELRTFLNAIAIGVLAFLFFDITAHANEIVEEALTESKAGDASWWRFYGYGALLAIGLGIGLVGLVIYERIATRQPLSIGAAAHVEGRRRFDLVGRWVTGPAQRLAVYIALGIGLHNLAEGLSIGQSAARDDINLAVMLVIGFALHNATEGFGIVAPLAADGVRPSVKFLVIVGLIGGAPTFIGTIVGNFVVNDSLFLIFLALAAGSILFVVIQLVQVGARLGNTVVFAWGILLGLLAGLATDYVLVAAGV